MTKTTMEQDIASTIPGSPVRTALEAAAPAMRDALALADSELARIKYPAENSIRMTVAEALALAGGATVPQAPAAPDYEAMLKDLAGKLTVEAVARILGVPSPMAEMLAQGKAIKAQLAGPDWRAIAAALLPYAESHADWLQGCTVGGSGDEQQSADYSEAVAAVDAAKAALAGDTVTRTPAPHDDADAAARKMPPVISPDAFDWQEIGEDESNKRTRLLASIQIGDCVFHVEAREFEADAEPQTTIEFGDDYDSFCDLAGQTDFAPVTIEGRQYFVFILPYEA